MNSSKRSRSDSNKRRGFLFRLLGSISIGKTRKNRGEGGRPTEEETGNVCFARGNVNLGSENERVKRRSSHGLPRIMTGSKICRKIPGGEKEWCFGGFGFVLRDAENGNGNGGERFGA